MIMDEKPKKIKPYFSPEDRHILALKNEFAKKDKSIQSRERRAVNLIMKDCI